MRPKTVSVLLIALLCVTLATTGPGATFDSDGSAKSVQLLHDNSAKDGDTITVPAGEFTWSTAVTISKGITIQGAGFESTKIVSSVNSNRFTLNTTSGKKYRITGLDLTGPAGLTNNNPTIFVKGFSHQVRVDNCRFDIDSTWNVFYGDWALGVIDHCQFYGAMTSIFVSHARWGNKTEGDGSYQDDPGYGTDKAVFIEDCYFQESTNRPMMDAEPGSRVVVRKNKMVNNSVQNHGNEQNSTTIGGRACRLQEVYENEASTNVGGPFVGTRGGSGVIWGNKLTRFNVVLSLVYYQSLMHDIGKTADGTRKWDQNEPGGPFYTGKHTGANASNVLVDSTKNWTPNQLVAYSVRNLTKQKSTMILANTANSLTSLTGDIGGSKMVFDTGDDYDIYKLKAGIDMPGMGNDTVLDWRAKQTTPKQPIEPYYVWGNTGVTGEGCSPRSACIVKGIHCIDGPKPGYTPFVYPHPLVSGEPTPEPTSTPEPTTTPSATATPTPTPDSAF
jgi:hypothetical protein